MARQSSQSPPNPKMTSFFRRVAPAEQKHAAQQQMAADKEELRQKRIAEEEVTAARPKILRLWPPAPTTNPYCCRREGAARDGVAQLSAPGQAQRQDSAGLAALAN